MASAQQLGWFQGQPYRMRRWKVGDGDSAIRKTVMHMARLVFGPEGVQHPEVRIAAIEAARGSLKNVNEIEAVFQWVKKNIEFRGENAETLQSPVVTLRLRAGDCDDHSVLMGALLASLGYQVRFKTVATIPSNPRAFSHVYVVVQDKRSRQWVPVDTTVRMSTVGWEPPVIYREKSYSLGDQPLLVPTPGAPAGLGPKGQLLYDLAAPFTQALASRIAHGYVPQAAVGANFNLGLAGPTPDSGLPTWAWLVLGGGVLILLFRSSR
jgi:transglutaminase-like putative cysteine protease